MLRHWCVFVIQLVFARVAATEKVESCAAELPALDTFTEELNLQKLPFVHSPNLFLARFEFSIVANLSAAFLTDQFDIFPKPLGKLVNGHPSLSAFEATLTRGRWKDEWGPLLQEFRPNGASLIATAESDEKEVVDKVWRFLISALSGTLCASFEGMDPGHSTMPFVIPMQLPWAEPGRQLQFATLPYEPVCTENLTPWLKLLPCGRRRGLASLIAPLDVAAAPLVSLSLAVTVNRGAGRVELQTSLDLVLPLRVDPGVSGLRAWFPVDSVEPCPSADDSRVLLRTKAMDKAAAQREGAELVHTTGDISTFVFATKKFIKLPNTQNLAARIDAGNRPKPWAVVHQDEAVPTGNNGLSVMRDILSQEGQSERTHGRYLLRFTNDGTGRRVRFMDQLPFFLSPMWHTFRATLQRPGEPAEELTGLRAMQRLQLKFMPPDSGQRSPTEVFLTVDVPPGGTVSVFLDVLKKFIKLKEFSYACEKGFDVSAAAWLEVDLPQDGNSSAIDDFIKSLASVKQGESRSGNEHWRFRFTSGLIVLVPMPDFSMPFNVISLSCTALTFFFGSIFRLTAAGRQKHWVWKEDGKKGDMGSRLTSIWRWSMLALTASIAGLNYLEDGMIKEFKETWPKELEFLADFLLYAKDSVGKFR